MVGCSALNCSNRSDKGFKTYRIPRDPIRRQEWIRFIGRDGWIPGSGASICEVHFEASAYELHRADGLKKLKQNAIPTVYVLNPLARNKRKQIVQPRPESPFDEGSDDSYSVLPPISVHQHGVIQAAQPVTTVEQEQFTDEVYAKEKITERLGDPVPNDDEQFCNATKYGCDFDGAHEKKTQVKRLKTVHIMEIVTNPKSQRNNVESGFYKESSEIVKEGCKSISSENTRSKTSEVLPQGKVKCGRHLKRRGRTKLVKKQSEQFIIKKCSARPEFELENEEFACPVNTPGVTEKIVTICFVCRKVIAPGYDVHLNVPAEASRTLLHECLASVLSFESRVGCHEVVCSRCCSLLNYIDRTESELTVLKGAISMCTKGKSEQEDLPNKSKLMKSEQILDRFSRGLDEKNYVMGLEELFIEKTEEKNTSDEHCQPVAVVDESSGKHQDLPEQPGMFEDEVLNAEPSGNGDIQGDIVAQERSEKIVAMENSDLASGKCHNLGDLVGLSETSSSLADETGNYSETGSSELAAHIDDDLKDYLGGQQKTHECKICCFKTIYESVMVWHLRMHMQTHRWCDFCSVAIPDKESAFVQLKKTKPNKLKSRKGSSKQAFILPAVPMEPITVSPIPLSSLNVPLLPLDDMSSESPVVLVDTQGLGSEFVSESVVEKGEDDSVRMEESQNSGVVIVSENVLLSEAPELLQSSIPSTISVTAIMDKGQQENYCDRTDLSQIRQENESLEIYCGIMRPPAVQIGKSDNSMVDVELSECLNNCCDVDENDVVGSLSGDHCHVASSECVHANDGLEDSIETNFLDTLTSQPVAKYPEILPEICDDATDQNTVSPVSGMPDDNIDNNDVNFVRNNAIGESDLALAYESSVAALMCQSDDSDGILY